MASATDVTVYFVCPQCGALYRAKQVRFYERISGRFDCEQCRTPVHVWSGFHGYLYWQSVKTKPRKR